MTDQTRRDAQDAADAQDARNGQGRAEGSTQGSIGGAAQGGADRMPANGATAAPNTISPAEAPPSGGGAAGGVAAGDGAAGGAATDRGLPELGQRRALGRPRAWWLTPLTIIVVAVAGAVWTVHGMLVRHEAEARARRDHAMEQGQQGRTFDDASSALAMAPGASDTSGVAHPTSSVAASAPVEARPVSRTASVAPARTYYDAPLFDGGAGGKDGSTPVVPEGGAGTTAGGAQAGVPRGALTAASASGGPLAQALSPTLTPRASASLLGDRNLILAQGAKIDCVGDTAFDSTEAGISTCTVTKNVYSDNGHVLLIERGSQVNTEYRANLGQGQRRVFILSARIKTPTGVTVEIDSPAADALGRMGVGGYVNNHWGERIGAALLLGLVQDSIGYLATRGGNDNGSIEFENTQQSGNDMATRVLDSTINIPPTLTQNQAAEFTIVIARDLDFSSVYALQPVQMEENRHDSP
ncbi:type IV secretion system protein VirB10 [Paraburkholderia sp. BCC1885]|uniref:type IV secretion system protein VirB10 n=1 Tax=Paraburkholderia sp. BCC1885 TaxID=2562669 RepID=UPI0021B36CE1|nr:type IV secretion system protein VirB10 [Paraburkholderia sp. BCC1885]